MNDAAQPKIGNNVTLNRSRLGQYVHLADDAILEEVEMGDYSYTAGHNQIFTPPSANSCQLPLMHALILAITPLTSVSPNTISPTALQSMTWEKTTKRSSTGGANSM